LSSGSDLSVPKSVESTRRVSGSPTNSVRTVRPKGYREHEAALAFALSAMYQEQSNLRDALVYKGTGSLQGSGKKG
jgi:hypothetical protein